MIDNSDGMNIYLIESNYLPRYIPHISVSAISVATHSDIRTFPKGLGFSVILPLSSFDLDVRLGKLEINRPHFHPSAFLARGI